MRRSMGLLGTGIAVTLLGSACGVGASSSSGDSTGPIKVALMGIFSGANAVQGEDDSFKLAVSQINAAGGILGRKVEYKEFNTDITPQGAATATSLAMQYKPSVVIGYGVSAGLKASINQLNAAGVPVIDGTLDKLTSPASLHSKSVFRLQLTTAQFATAADQFLMKGLGVKAMMVINTQDAAPSDGAGDILADAAKDGVTTQHQAVPPTVTDLTEQILAAKSMGAQAIWEWGYATTDALAIKTAATNGYSGAIMTFSADTAVASGLIPKSMLTDKVYVIPGSCEPAVVSTPQAEQFVSAFEAKFGAPPTSSSGVNSYDSLKLYAAAAKQAKTTDYGAVVKALSTIDYQGVCGELKADANQNLEHSVPIIDFPGGKPTLAKLIQNVASPY